MDKPNSAAPRIVQILSEEPSDYIKSKDGWRRKHPKPARGKAAAKRHKRERQR
jgi:hypothetical protein